MEKHSFVVTAYKESPYLEDCIKSLINQTKKTAIIITSSTPCVYIDNIARKYGIKCYYREGKSDIKDDWNYACKMAQSQWVTVAHQDDVYEPEYAEKVYNAIEGEEDAVMLITDYFSLIEGVKGKNRNSRIRRFLRLPMKNQKLASRVFWKKGILALGNSICCPTVAYNKNVIEGDVFTSNMKFNIDWDTFYKYAHWDKKFIYIDKPLVAYRIHKGATTVKCMDGSLRIKEDTEMFSKFWPMWMVKVIMFFYKKAYEEYK